MFEYKHLYFINLATIIKGIEKLGYENQVTSSRRSFWTKTLLFIRQNMAYFGMKTNYQSFEQNRDMTENSNKPLVKSYIQAIAFRDRSDGAKFNN